MGVQKPNQKKMDDKNRKNKEQHDKFSKLEHGKQKKNGFGKDFTERSLEKKERKKHNKPKKEEPVATETPVTPANDDPNRQLSPDEIAALFAASEPTPKSDEEARLEEQKMDEALAAQTTAAPTVTPVSDDPNKQLTPDEIAALFASLG